MEINNGRSREAADWRMFYSQNPTNNFAPSSSTANGGSIIQDHCYTTMRSSYANGGFPIENAAFPFMNKEERRPPAMATHFAGANPVRSILDYSDNLPALSPDPFNPYAYSDSNNGHRSSLNGFLETLNDRNLEINFNRLNISSPNHHYQRPYYPSPPPFPPTSFLNNVPAPVPFNRNPRCNDVCCNPPRVNYGSVTRQGFGNFVDASNGHARHQAKRNKFSAFLKDLRGKIRMVAKDQEGCQFLQSKCEEGKAEDVEMIFNEIKDHIYELMTDASMNYLAQKLFKVCNERQMTHIVVYVISDDSTFKNICVDAHGTRAMQKLIELLKTSELRSLMVSALRRITLTLSKNTNGQHVLQHCFKTFLSDEIKPIVNVVADNCLDIAKDKSGCCVIQAIVINADERSQQRLMSEIIENALDLSEHQYGNYVVQHIIGMQIPEATAEIMKNLAGNFVHLAMNKFASNVVEKFLKESHDDQTTSIIREIVHSPNFLALVQHPYGNYVAQSVLLTAKGSLKEMMINKIQKEYGYLHSHPHGKRVLALARNSRPRGSMTRA